MSIKNRHPSPCVPFLWLPLLGDIYTFYDYYYYFAHICIYIVNVTWFERKLQYICSRNYDGHTSPTKWFSSACAHSHICPHKYISIHRVLATHTQCTHEQKVKVVEHSSFDAEPHNTSQHHSHIRTMKKSKKKEKTWKKKFPLKSQCLHMLAAAVWSSSCAVRLRFCAWQITKKKNCINCCVCIHIDWAQSSCIDSYTITHGWYKTINKTKANERNGKTQQQQSNRKLLFKVCVARAVRCACSKCIRKIRCEQQRKLHCVAIVSTMVFFFRVWPSHSGVFTPFLWCTRCTVSHSIRKARNERLRRTHTHRAAAAAAAAPRRWERVHIDNNFSKSFRPLEFTYYVVLSYRVVCIWVWMGICVWQSPNLCKWIALIFIVCRLFSV